MHVDSYYSATARDRDGFDALGDDIEADVVIIGGGFSGISAAVELAERGCKVVVLEAKKIGWGASGRNGGQITGSLSGDDAMQRLFAKSLGKRNAEDYVWDLRWRGHDIIRNRIEKYKIECDLKFGHIQAAMKKSHMLELGRVAELCRSFNRILCTKGEYLWETNQQQNLDRKSCVLH